LIKNQIKKSFFIKLLATLSVQSPTRFSGGAIKNFINSNAQLNPNNFTPSQNFLAENFTLPQGEGDCTELYKADCTEFHNEVLLG
jgi:hypothetical protein